MLVPKIKDTDEVDLTRVRWILVVEKEVSTNAASLVTAQNAQ